MRAHRDALRGKRPSESLANHVVELEGIEPSTSSTPKRELSPCACVPRLREGMLTSR